MAPPKLIVCERTGRWAAALRRLLADGPIDLMETRSLPECGEELAAAPASFLALEASPRSAQDVVYFLAGVDRWYPQARCLVLADGLDETWRGVFGEAGAVGMAATRRALRRWIGPIRWHFAPLPRGPRTLREKILNRLPWPTTAT
jgi:hypothetical protein